VRIGRFRCHFLPGRGDRPGADAPKGREGLLRPHEPCPFDGEGFVRERELCRLARGGREYHLVANRFPVFPEHFVAVRPDGAPASTLSQHLSGTRDIEDIVAFLRAAGPRYRAYFNSNPGADGSRSGSSVNHWHFQLFAYPWERTPLEERAGEWPARHLAVEDGDPSRLAGAAWRLVERIHALDAAYNIEARELSDGRLRAVVFARRPAPDREVPGAGTLSSNFGGCEMSGDLVLSSRPLLEWHARHPEAAERLSEERLRETTRAIDEPGRAG